MVESVPKCYILVVFKSHFLRYLKMLTKPINKAFLSNRGSQNYRTNQYILCTNRIVNSAFNHLNAALAFYNNPL